MFADDTSPIQASNDSRTPLAANVLVEVSRGLSTFA